MGDSREFTIKHGTVVLNDELRRLDIAVSQGRITALGENLDPGQGAVLDAAGLHIFPGVIDMHVHFNEPGLGSWEGFASGTAALAAGGCTAYADMPLNGVPPTVTVSALEQKLAAAEAQSLVDYALWGGLVPGKLDQLEPLANTGVIGFKAFMSNPGGEGEDIFRQADDSTLFEGMQRIAGLGGILALHAENEAMVSALAASIQEQGRTGALDYAESRPAIAELAAVELALLYAEQTGCALHFVHISSGEAVDRITSAKARGLDVTVETCPHYLALTDDDLLRLGAVAKCAPPLRSKAEQDRLWSAVAAGKIDLIASDHSPCPPDMKRDDNFFRLWGGISGAQSTLELMIDEGYRQRGIPLPQLARLLSYNPAVRFGLHPRKGEIRIGADADFALVNLNEGYTLQKEHLLDKHKQSPYTGRKFSCRVQTTISRGTIVYTVTHGAAQVKEGIWLQPMTL